MNLLQILEQEHVEKLLNGKKIQQFKAGDTVRVKVKIKDGDNERVQVFEGCVIGRKNRGINSSFRVRKVAYGVGVERVFQLYSPNIEVERVREGRVRRAKLYFLRERSGKSARIAQLEHFSRRGAGAGAAATVAAEVAAVVTADVAEAAESATTATV